MEGGVYDAQYQFVHNLLSSDKFDEIIKNNEILKIAYTQPIYLKHYKT